MSTVKREYNYDLLRILSTVAVVLIHVNAHYFNGTMNTGSPINLIENFINIITRFSVPCFVMISGAFLLHNEKNMDYKKFYSKTFYKTVIPFIII